jgi:hypothetical protein
MLHVNRSQIVFVPSSVTRSDGFSTADLNKENLLLVSPLRQHSAQSATNTFVRRMGFDIVCAFIAFHLSLGIKVRNG